jgi:D-serine deaminase-like pyridoxal phosphate-dependent protein
LGYKAIAAENPPPRVEWLNLPGATAVMHSEEHLVVELPDAAAIELGTLCYGVPRHICPTVALYDEALAVLTGRVSERWPIDARDRRI